MNTNKIFIQITNIAWIIGGITLVAFGMYLIGNTNLIEEVAREKKILDYIYNFLWAYVIIWLFEVIWTFILIFAIKSLMEAKKF